MFCFFSDDGEREDSDNDVHSSPKRIDREYRDTMENVDKVVKPNDCQAFNSPAKTNRPVKKIDLGAAANYGKDFPQVRI